MHVLTLSRAPQSRPRVAVLALAFLCSGACNALDAPGPKGSVVIIPTDVRVAQLTAAPPSPISGGTLTVSTDGKLAVAADPDRDRVSLVDLDTQRVRHVVLEQGDEPGRVVLDDGGRAFVALRRGGALAVIDVASGALQQRLPVCAAPRGMAFDAAQRLLHVACQDGRLLSVSLPGPVAALPVTDRGSQPAAAALEVVRDVQVGLDLRDVMLRDSDQGQQLWVSSFKRVELTQVGKDGEVVARVAPTNFVVPNIGFTPQGTDGPSVRQPHIAYRSFADGVGNLFVLHQGESTQEVDIDQPSDQSGNEGSPYGGSGSCGGIITPAITTFDPRTDPSPSPSPKLKSGLRTIAAQSGVLSVDMAVSADSGTLAVVQAGATDPGAPARETFFDFSGSSVSATGSAPPSFGASTVNTSVADGTTTRVSFFDRNQPGQDCLFGPSVELGGQSTSVAFRPRLEAATSGGLQPAFTESDWVVQSREPARLTLLTLRTPGNFSATVIELAGDSVRDTGHDLFHRDAGAGVACASCHAEGGEDGHVWNFSRLGLRRTQALHVGLEGTAPFHWAGDERDLKHLMSDVFVGRMGGVHQSDERVSALTRWLFALQPPAALTVAGAEAESARAHGQTLFESPEVGCSSCHSGDKLTNNRTVDVGTGEALQVPSLRGIAYRAPFMHDGCALSLRDRFDPACGGKAHGNISALQPSDVDDLVAYLQTL